MSRLLLLVVPAILAGFFVGRLTGEATTREPTPSPAPTAQVARTERALPHLATCQATIPPDEIAALKRELVAAVSPAIDPIAAVDVAPTTESSPDPGAIDRTLAIVDGALAAGSWRDEDATRFGALLAELGTDDRRVAVGALTRALNERRLAISVRGPLF